MLDRGFAARSASSWACRLSAACCCLLITGAALATSPGHRIRRVSALCAQGYRALQARDIDRAAELFERALALESRFPDAHLGLGHVAMYRAQYEEAARDYERARDSYVALGDRLYEHRAYRYWEAQREIPELRDQIRAIRSPMSGIPLATQDVMVREIERQIEALEAMELPRPELLADPPGEVFFHHGNALFHLGRFDEAITDWEACAAKLPRFAAVQVNLAVGYWRLGRLDDARTRAERAKELGASVHPDIERDLAAANRSVTATPRR